MSTGLIAYGLIGLALALIGAFALVWVGGRVGAVADRTGEQVESIVSTLDATANVLASMGTSATSFSGTLERTPPAVRQTAATVANLRANLTLVQGQLAAINILGARPLADAANLFGQMATDLEGLDGRLEVIAADLDANRTALVDNSTTLQALGTELDGVADDLRAGSIEESLADVQLILIVLSGLLIVWALLPAVGRACTGLVASTRAARPRRRRGGCSLTQVVTEGRSRRVVAAHAVDAAARRRRGRAQVQARARVIRIEARDGAEERWRMSEMPALMSPPM